MTIIDTIKSPPVAAMRAAGVVGLCRYLSWADGRDTLGKVIHRAEYDQLLAAGFTVLLNWEYSATDWLGGSSAGAAHAAEAVRQARALGYPAGCAIVGSADFNMSSTQWNTSGAAYARAFRDGVRSGGYAAGVYGPWDVLGWCQGLGFSTFWQAGMSTAWSGGRNAQPWPGAHLRQRGHVTIAGQDCDYNDVLQPNYGQAGGDVALHDEIIPGTAGDTGSNRPGDIALSDIWAGEQLDTSGIAPGIMTHRQKQLKRIEDGLAAVNTALAAVAAPTQDQVDAAVAKALPAALAAAVSDPATLSELGSAIVAAFKAS